MIKFLQFSIISSILSMFAIVGTIHQAEAKIFNRFKKGFYFEKYKTAAEAEEKLLKLHPIESPVDDLVITLEKSGAIAYKPTISKRYQNNPELKNMMWFKYKHRTFNSLFPREWSISIEKGELKKLKRLSLTFYQGA